MHYVLLLSLLAYGLHGLPFGAAAPLPSTSSLSLKERTSNLPNSEREFSSLTSSPTPSTTVHSPSFKRGLLLPLVTSIATSPLTPGHARKRQDNHSIEASLGMAKRSEDTPRLTERQQEGSATEETSPNKPGEEPRVWSGLDSRSADSDNVDSIVGVRANTPAAKDPDPNYDEEKHCWAPKHSPLYFAGLGVASMIAFDVFAIFVILLIGWSHAWKLFAGIIKTYWKCLDRGAEKLAAKRGE